MAFSCLIDCTCVAYNNLFFYIIEFHKYGEKYPPFHILTLMPDGNITDTGAGKEYFSWFERKLKFKYVIQSAFVRLT